MTSNTIKLETKFFDAVDNQVSHAHNHKTLDTQQFITQAFLSMPPYQYKISLGTRK